MSSTPSSSWTLPRSTRPAPDSRTSSSIKSSKVIPTSSSVRSALELLPAQQASLAKPPTANSEAHELYLKGRYFWNKRTEEGFNKAIDSFQQAIEKDSDYALAYAGLADSYTALAAWGIAPPQEAFPKAKKAAVKALEIDNTLAEAHTSLGGIQQAYEWDFSGGEASLKRAIELNPGYATAHHWYAIVLAATGRHSRAAEEMERALESDPLSLIMYTDAGFIRFLARDYDQAIDAFQQALNLDPSFHAAQAYLGLVYMQKGLKTEAIVELTHAVTLPDATVQDLAYLGCAYAVLGLEDEARKVLTRLKDQAKQEYVPLSLIARIYANLGETDQAFAWLERACDQRDTFLAYLKVTPLFDPLRADLRFDDLLRRIGLEP